MCVPVGGQSSMPDDSQRAVLNDDLRHRPRDRGDARMSPVPGAVGDQCESDQHHDGAP